MALVPITIFGQFTTAEVIFLASIADHVYTDGQLIIGNGATGGVSISTLTQGAGVTITNGNGTITIASTGGGGGFTVLVATEIPNGTLQTFTFPSASAQPTFLLADNALMKAINADTSVNWTWNVGAKQATFFGPYAPTNDIGAIQ